MRLRGEESLERGRITKTHAVIGSGKEHENKGEGKRGILWGERSLDPSTKIDVGESECSKKGKKTHSIILITKTLELGKKTRKIKR